MSDMELLTLDSLADAGVSESSRSAVFQRLAQLATAPEENAQTDRELSALAQVVVDALLDLDAPALESLVAITREQLAVTVIDGQHREVAGWMKAYLAMARWALSRLPSREELALRGNTQAWRFVSELAGEVTLTSSDLRERLDTGESQVSRVGRELLARGLVVQHRAGRTATWELTPRGRALFKELSAGEAGREVDAVAASSGARRGRSSSGSSRSTSRSSSGKSRSSSRSSAGSSRATSRSTSSGSRSSSRSSSGSSARKSSSRASATQVQAASAKRGKPTAGEARATTVARTETTRFVQPHPEGEGWRVTSERGRTIERLKTKQEAIRRAKEIVERHGGGQVVAHKQSGEPGDPIAVKPKRSK
jgi:DNA-binding MarR family transcriptional regulator